MLCPILKGDMLETQGGLAALLWPQGGAQLCGRERETPKPWSWGKTLFPDPFLGKPSHRMGLSASPGSLCTSGVEQLGLAGSVQHWHPGRNTARTHIPYLICSIFPPRCLLWPCFLNQLTAAGWAVTSACGIEAPDPGWHWRDPGMSPSNPCEPMNPLVGDSKRHLRTDTAALDSREGPCPQQGHRAVLEGHLNPSCPASTTAVTVLP